MDKSAKMNQPRKRRGSMIWNGLNRGTAWFYAILLRSFIGRILTGYRKADHLLAKGKRYPGQHSCTPVSPVHLRLVEALESSRLFGSAQALFRALALCPTAVYGLFGLTYGLFGILFYYVFHVLLAYVPTVPGHILVCVIITILSAPLAFASKPLRSTMVDSLIGRLILIRFLGIPEDRLQVSEPTGSRIGYYLACPIGLLAAGAALFISPWVIPLVLAGMGLLGVIFIYPEAGVVLSVAMLPVAWLDRRCLLIPVVLILITWGSYLIKVLCLHRTMRFGLLERVILIFGLIMVVSTFTGEVVTPETVWQNLSLLIFLSQYFLIVNLMTTRAYIRRCLVGIGASLAVVILLSYLRLIPVDSLSWLEGSRAGDAIIGSFRYGIEHLSELWVEHSELYLVLSFSWLYAYLLHTKRLLRKIVGSIFVLLALVLVLMTGSVSALFCMLGVTVLFLLMLGHKWMSAGLLTLPVVGCGVYWLTYLYPISDALQTILSRSRLYKAQLGESLWNMVLDYPAGIGVGDAAFAAVYPSYAAPDLVAVTDCNNMFFELLLSYGWAGLILIMAIFFVFVQKSLTCLRHTVVFKDRAMILGGVTSVVSVLIFGTVRNFITSPRVFFTIFLVIALCSAYESILFDESDVREVEWSGSPYAANRFYRSGEYKNISQKE